MRVDPVPLAESGPWRVVGVSVQGASHRRGGEPCQDAHAWARLPGGILVAAVADGAGTVPHADVGSAIAARTAVEELRAHYAGERRVVAAAVPEALRAAVRAARGALEAEAVRRGVESEMLATTLVATLATPRLVALAQVGDGALVLEERGGELRRLDAGASPSEYLNETIFLTSPGALDGLNPMVWEGKAAYLALLTDGLSLLALLGRAGIPHGPFFEPLFRFVVQQPEPQVAEERLRAFLSGPRVSARTEDDVTLVLAALL